jgi:hypothetical protein
MNIYLIKRTDKIGYDEYKGAVVVADSEESARKMHPNGQNVYIDSDSNDFFLYDWIHPKLLEVTLIGIARTTQVEGVILASYKAG